MNGLFGLFLEHRAILLRTFGVQVRIHPAIHSPSISAKFGLQGVSGTLSWTSAQRLTVDPGSQHSSCGAVASSGQVTSGALLGKEVAARISYGIAWQQGLNSYSVGGFGIVSRSFYRRRFPGLRENLLFRRSPSSMGTSPGFEASAPAVVCCVRAFCVPGAAREG